MRVRLLILVYVVGLAILSLEIGIGASFALLSAAGLCAVVSGKPYYAFRTLRPKAAIRRYLSGAVRWSRAQFGFIAAAISGSMLLPAPDRLLAITCLIALLTACFAAARVGCLTVDCCGWTAERKMLVDGRAVEVVLATIAISVAGLLVWIRLPLIGFFWLVSAYISLRTFSLLMQARFWLAKRESACLGCGLAGLIVAMPWIIP